MNAEDFTPEDLAKAQRPTPTQSPAQLQDHAQQASSSVGQVINPLKEIANSGENTKTDGNYWPIEDLPSKFLLYPEGTKIYARPLKVLEVKMLSSLTNDNFHYVITEVLKKAVDGIDVENLLVADKLYIIFWLRANTYKNSGYTVDFDCTLCETSSKYEFEINNLDIIDIKDDYQKDKTVVLPINKDSLTTRQLFIRDENTVKNFLNRNKRSLQNYDEDILILANLVDTINGKSISLMEKYNYLINLEPIDYGKIESYINHYDMGISPLMNVECKNCGGTAPVAVGFHPEFFVPKAGLE
tara:strand:+ start:6658 stop:7554 length:897 start_codon:yes stop_codon:yes gene_type:complete